MLDKILEEIKRVGNTLVEWATDPNPSLLLSYLLLIIGYFLPESSSIILFLVALGIGGYGFYLLFCLKPKE